MNHKKSAILITGAGSGIGEAIAHVLASRHPEIPLILAGRNGDHLQKTLNTIAHKEIHQILPLDLRNQQSIQSAHVFLKENHYVLKGLIHNAGIGGENTYGTADRWDEIIATNLTGPYQLTQELLPLMKSESSEFKRIIFISSILAQIGVPKYNAYSASKAGLLGLMRSLAAELAEDKILVNAICPGWVDTQMSKDGIQAMATASGKSFKEIKKQQMEVVPLGKMSDPKEVAELVSFLMSDFQGSITGQTLNLNNGALMS